MELLNGDNTHGYDHDKQYYIDGQYYLIEFLNCDTISPYGSDPKNYPKNWRKFYSLWQSALALDAVLILVNYSSLDKKDTYSKLSWKDQIKIMVVTGFDYKALNDYLEKNDYKAHCQYLKGTSYKMTFDQFTAYLKKLNHRSENHKPVLPDEFKNKEEL